MPLRQGFDQFAGVPYSHDMWPRHPENPKGYPDLPLYDGDKVVVLFERVGSKSLVAEFARSRQLMTVVP